MTGGSAGTRTQGHLIKSQMLYQLSYRPTVRIIYFPAIGVIVNEILASLQVFQRFDQLVCNFPKCLGCRRISFTVHQRGSAIAALPDFKFDGD